MNLEQLGQVATGGSINSVTEDANGQLWVASLAGLFCQTASRWRSMNQQLPIAYVDQVIAIGDTLFVCGEGKVLRSSNQGKSWHRCLIEQTDEAVYKICASPTYAHDRVILAGSGAGVLRSTNGGKHFELVNFGLEEPMSMAVAVAPTWGKRNAIAFAFSPAAVYQSPNGGRAWRKGTIPPQYSGHLIHTMAVSPQFETDQTVFIGLMSEAKPLTAESAGGAENFQDVAADHHEVLISADGGQTFAPFLQKFEPIISLTCPTDGVLMIGTLDGLHRATFDGALEKVEVEAFLPYLFQLPSGTYLGTEGAGLLHSADFGRTFQPISELIARRFIQFHTPAPNLWLAAGPDEGVWRSTDQGQSWQRIWEPNQWSAGAVNALVATGNEIWLGLWEGIVYSPDGGTTWGAYQEGHEFAAILKTDNAVWSYSNHAGQLWRDKQLIDAPFSGGDLLNLYEGDGAVIAAVWRADAGVIQLWRTQDNGQTWSRWFAESARRIIPQISFGEQILVGIGRKLYQQTPSGWQPFNTSSPIVAIVQFNSQTVIVQSDQLAIFSNNALTVTPLDLDGQTIASAAISNNNLILCTTIGTIINAS